MVERMNTYAVFFQAIATCFTSEGYFSFTASPLMKNVWNIYACDGSDTIGVATGCGPSSKVRKIPGESIFRKDPMGKGTDQ